MPELPEVETVKRELEKKIKNKIFLKPIIYYPNCVKTDLNSYINDIENKKIISLSRRGKFLIINLSDKEEILFHLRMEGKLFVVNKNNYETKHLSLFIPFKDDEEGLAFYDVRKFGVTYLIKDEKDSPLSTLGPEPFDLNDSSYLFDKYSKSNKPIKELLLDQNIMCGLGNIYADEVLFASTISPFKEGRKISEEECSRILKNSKEILNLAILNKGSTVRSYKASQHVKGSFQSFLKVYSKENQLCSRCKSYHIKKRKLDGRGTSYCPKCQHTLYSICLTGKIASGKSEVLKILKKNNFVIFSADDEVKNILNDEKFKKILKKKFPYIFLNDDIDKNKVFTLLFEDKVFSRNYLNLIYSELKNRINDFIIKNDGVRKAFEVPRVYDAKMEKIFDFIIGVESINQKENLYKREKSIKKLSFNDLNSYDKHKRELDYIIHNDNKIEDLEEEVSKMISFLDKK